MVWPSCSVGLGGRKAGVTEEGLHSRSIVFRHTSLIANRSSLISSYRITDLCGRFSSWLMVRFILVSIWSVLSSRLL